jgi:NAD(P)H-flavin reductase
MKTGIAALAPLGFLCIHSLPILRRVAYETFVTLHVPVSMVYTAMLFWHCKNYLTSWRYLYATVVIWGTSYIARLFFLNWSNPFHMSFLVGEDAWVSMMPENAVKVTIATKVRWRPGQYVYLRMPGVEVFGNHPFTIASLCSDDMPSDMGYELRDMALVFRPFGGFTRRVMDAALEKGPYHTYRAFIDGPYGGMKRRLESFDHVVLVAGGSGITAVVSQLLDLIKRMRDSKAITVSVRVIWALKRPETMEWFKEELRICREYAPPDSVKCQFFITAAKRVEPRTFRMTAQSTQQHISTYFRDHINDTFQGIADKRASYYSKRNSAYIQDAAEGDEEIERQLRDENEDVIAALPRAQLEPGNTVPSQPSHIRNFSHPLAGEEASPEQHEPEPSSKRQLGRDLSLDVQSAIAASPAAFDPSAGAEAGQHFSFGFPSTPTEFQKNLMRFAFLPAAARTNDGWTTEYGRPDLPFLLRDMAQDFGKRTCVFVCGPPGMRIAVANTVAELQRHVLGNKEVEEIFLHTENYAL